MNLKTEILELGKRGLRASRGLALLGDEEKREILLRMADSLRGASEQIREANGRDLDAGEKAGLNAAMLDRLELTDLRMEQMIAGIEEVAELADPVGQVLKSITNKDGLLIEKVRVPIGVIAIIYESRPNVTADASALCLRSGNAVFLKGGREALESNSAIVGALRDGIRKLGEDENFVQLLERTEREAVRELVQLEGIVDLVIPRGGEGLIRAVTEQSRVPVLKHYKGVCHVFVDKSADLEMALKIVENAKCQRPGVCNAMETLLVHADIAAEFLPQMAGLLTERGVELRGDALAREIVPEMKEAREEDWFAEYLELVLSVRVLEGIDAAIEHINHYGSHHSDAIISADEVARGEFVSRIDSGSVLVNASTRFTDGSVYGMGAEIGISTDKLHARGPMGLEDLTTYKYVVTGSGQVRH